MNLQALPSVKGVAIVNGAVAYLQLFGVANDGTGQNGVGDLKSGDTDSESTARLEAQILLQPAAIMILFIIFDFWLGK